MVKDEETVRTFGDMTERWWMMFMLLADLLSEIFKGLIALLQSLFDDDPLARSRDEDRALYRAA